MGMLGHGRSGKTKDLRFGDDIIYALKGIIPVLINRSSITILFFILMLYPILSTAGQYKVVRVTDGDTIKLRTSGSEADIIIRLVGIEAPETAKKKNESGLPSSQKSTKYLSGLVLNKSVEIKSYGTYRYCRTLDVVYWDGKNVNLIVRRLLKAIVMID